jgi:hypothetical protein
MHGLSCCTALGCDTPKRAGCRWPNKGRYSRMRAAHSWPSIRRRDAVNGHQLHFGHYPPPRLVKHSECSDRRTMCCSSLRRSVAAGKTFCATIHAILAPRKLFSVPLGCRCVFAQPRAFLSRGVVRLRYVWSIKLATWLRSPCSSGVCGIVASDSCSLCRS